jgi:hypothetical protein
MKELTERENGSNKKEWIPPNMQIIPFSNTLNGNATSVEETLGGTIKTIS